MLGIRKQETEHTTPFPVSFILYYLFYILYSFEFNYGAALEKLQNLLKLQQEPLGILGAIGKHFRQIAAARTLLDHGKTASELMKLYSMSDYPARKTMEAAHRFRPEFLAKAAQLVLETDAKIKTSVDDPERLLELLILQLAQEAMA